MSNQKTNERKEEATEKSSLNDGAAKVQEKKTGIGLFAKAGVSLLAVVGAGVGGHAVRNAASRLGNVNTQFENNVPSAQLLKEDSAFTAVANENIFASKEQYFFCKNGDDCFCYPNGYQDGYPDADFCGGGDQYGDAWTQLSCSPYQYKPNVANRENPKSDGSPRDDNCGCAPNCNDPYLDVISYGAGYKNEQAGYVMSGSNVWASDTNEWWLPAGSGTARDYFVFHGCDGAGLQSDCFGDIKYAEHIVGLHENDYYNIHDGKNLNGDDNPPNGGYGICNDPNDNYGRTYCKFVHPGTMTYHQEYFGGFHSECNGFENTNMGDDGALCITKYDFKSTFSGPWKKGNLDKKVLNIPNDYFGGQHPFADEAGYRFSFMMYPWRCNNGGSGVASLFSYPSIYQNGYECYVDNEPDDSAPPHIEFYFGILLDNGVGDEMWLHKFESDGDFNVNFVTGYDNFYKLFNVAKS